MAQLTAVREEVIEQVMRVATCDVTVLPFLDALPGSKEAAAALGRLLGDHPVRLVAGCPLVAWVRGGTVTPAWREIYPPAPESLWSHLEFLKAMHGEPTASNPYEALEELRALADQTFGEL